MKPGQRWIKRIAPSDDPAAWAQVTFDGWYDRDVAIERVKRGLKRARWRSAR
jgi:hypothetical protein